MKKKLFILVPLFSISLGAQAQWATNGNDIHNTNTGNVGIGITTPAWPLDIFTNTNGSVTVQFKNASNGSSARTRFTLANDVGSAIFNFNSSTYPTDPNSLTISSGPGGSMTFITAGFERMRISNGGMIGIGTATPAAPLDVQNNVNGTTSLSFTNSSTGSLARARLTLSNGASYAVINLNGSGYTTDPNSLAINAASGGSLMFGNSSGERIRIAPSGNVGISTTTPFSPLDVRLGTDQHIQFAANVNGSYTGTPGIVCRNDVNSGYTPLGFYASNYYFGGGNVGIATTDTKGYTFAVNGTAIATQMTVKLFASWPDYVFKPAYHLIPLSEVKSFIFQNQHLPDLPTAQEIAKNGINLGEMNKLLVKKVEELTLYLIDKDSQVNDLHKQVNTLQEEVNQLQQHLNTLAKSLNKQ
jgi:hypothetical protein